MWKIFFKKNWSDSQPASTCSKLTIKIPERPHLRRSGAFIHNFELISRLVLVFPLITLTCNCRLGYSLFKQTISPNFLMGVFYQFYLIHSWILWPVKNSNAVLTKLTQPKHFMAPFYGVDSTVSRLLNHFKETV